MFKTEKISHNFDNVFDFIQITSDENCKINYLKYSDKTEEFVKEEYHKLNFLQSYGFVKNLEDFKSKLCFIVPNSLNSNYIYNFKSSFAANNRNILSPANLFFNIKTKIHEYTNRVVFDYKTPFIVFFDDNLTFDFFKLNHKELEIFINNSRKFPDNLLDYNGNKLVDNCPFIIEEYDNIYLIEHYYVYNNYIYVSNENIRGNYNKWSTGKNFGRKIDFDDIIKFKLRSLTPEEYVIFKLKE